ncbi:class I SAM-dependent methyltransferase [Mycobacterium sp. M1]|uniref:Class I SAM-dependent methyltransferase n=1 Tax=Mycolicibacter acidiphilus TaxID=2835306 RepID=A0ABS5RKW3_9MYCO|nr:class I SAM-dependent methyltransferase [Mycolicibacter acidiphilus]MBS9533569.1 class I SAM-dependent methyltransferase [Mycolicibacter acidiphilus]
MLDMVDAASAAILVSIGHRTGLFDTLAGRPPATSAAIAEAAGLNERYVREWLGGMVTGRVVDYDPATSTYTLPAQRAAVLTRAAGVDNLASLAMSVPMMGEVEEQIVDCFRDGGGLPYSAYPRFHAIQAEQSAQILDAALIDEILPLVDGLQERLYAGIDVADIGCGSGHAVNLMAREYPLSRFTGIDFSDESLAVAVAEAGSLGVRNAVFEARDVARLQLTEAYDVVTAFDSIHDQAQPAQVLAGIHAALRSGGVFLMADIKASSLLEENVGVPLASYLYAISTMHCMSVSLAFDGAGLGTVWGHQLATRMLRDAGFTDVTVAEVAADPGNYYYLARK